MTSDKFKNLIVQVCFPTDQKENFAIVIDVSNNKSCESHVFFNFNLKDRRYS
jgi:hypothetical protein